MTVDGTVFNRQMSAISPPTRPNISPPTYTQAGINLLLLYGVSTGTFFIALTLAIMSAALSPLAGMACALVARSRGLDAKRYGPLGMATCLLLTLPWIFTIVRMLGGNIDRRAITLAYLGVYGAWALGILAFNGFLATLESTPILIAIPIQGATLLLSMMVLASARHRQGTGEESGTAREESAILPDQYWKYLQPFVMMLFWLGVSYGLLQTIG